MILTVVYLYALAHAKPRRSAPLAEPGTAEVTEPTGWAVAA